MTAELELSERLRSAFVDLGPTPAEAAEATGEPCPEPAEIWRLVRGRLTPWEVGAVVDHAACCASCAHELSAAREMAMELGEAPERLPDPKPRPWAPVSAWLRLQWVWLASPALAAASAVLLFMVAGEPRAGGPETRNLGMPIHTPRAMAGLPSMGTPELVVISGGTLPRERFLLRWRGPEGAVYDVVVESANLEPIYEVRDLEKTELLVPRERLRGVQSGEPLIWRVDAYRPDGRRETSVTSWVEIR